MPAFDHVGIQRALREEPCPTVRRGFGFHLAGGLAEHVDETMADQTSLLLRIIDADEIGQEFLFGVHDSKIDVEVIPEGRLDQGPFLFPKEAVVDEDAGQLITDRPLQKSCHHAAVHAAGEAADHPVVSHLLSDPIALGVEKLAHSPVAGAAADAEQEVAENVHAVRRVGDFGMELNAPDRAFTMPDRREGTGLRGGDRLEPLGQSGDLVAVTHPDRCSFGNSGEEALVVENLQLSPSVLSVRCILHLAAQHLAGQLHSVTDTEHRNAEFENPRIAFGRARCTDTRRPSGQNDPSRVQTPNRLDVGIRCHQQTEGAKFTHSSGDQLRVLASEVENRNGLGGRNQVRGFRGGS